MGWIYNINKYSILSNNITINLKFAHIWTFVRVIKTTKSAPSSAFFPLHQTGIYIASKFWFWRSVPPNFFFIHSWHSLINDTHTHTNCKFQLSKNAMSCVEGTHFFWFQFVKFDWNDVMVICKEKSKSIELCTDRVKLLYQSYLQEPNSCSWLISYNDLMFIHWNQPAVGPCCIHKSQVSAWSNYSRIMLTHVACTIDVWNEKIPHTMRKWPVKWENDP